jgi:thiamine pyrophosphate-dependent acetolactate synthase large subunit-like protein
MGRMSRSEADWKARVALAEKLQAQVVTDLKNAASFPTAHPQHAAPPGYFMNPEACAAVRDADVVLVLDWVDPGGAFKQALQGEVCQAKVIQVSLDMHIHRGWSMDMGSLPPSDLFMLSEPDAAVHALLAACSDKPQQTWPAKPVLPALPDGDVISLRALSIALEAASQGTPLCVARLPLGWHGAYRDFTHPLDYLGADGGGGIGAGPGNAVGVALALRDAKTDRLPVALIGDGDFLMGNTAVWTAVRYGIPVLIIVCNNHSFFNDELHQERVAKERNRPTENKWIGQRMSEPEINIALMASAMGATTIGPVSARHDLQAAIAQGLDAVRQGKTCVIDVNVAPGYDTNMSGQNSTQSSVHKR